MLTIKETGRELDKRDAYKMSKSPSIKRMRDIIGAVLSVDTYAIYEDTKDDGKSIEVLSIMTKDGEVFATNSATFKRDFLDIVELMDGDDYEIEVISGTSKSGREFITCALV